MSAASSPSLSGGLSRTATNAARDRRRSAAWLGLAPFTLYVLLFLGLPLYEVVRGAFTTEAGALTFSNIGTTFDQPQYVDAFEQSLLLAAWTSFAGAFFGTWLAYFAGVPLAFAFIAALGQTGVATILLRHIGIDPSRPTRRRSHW